MAVNVNFKSLLIGLLLGAALILALGAALNPQTAGKYNVAICLNEDGSVVFARIDTCTGEIEACRQGVMSIFPKPNVYMSAKKR